MIVDLCNETTSFTAFPIGLNSRIPSSVLLYRVSREIMFMVKFCVAEASKHQTRGVRTECSFMICIVVVVEEASVVVDYYELQLIPREPARHSTTGNTHGLIRPSKAACHQSKRPSRALLVHVGVHLGCSEVPNVHDGPVAPPRCNSE